MSAHTDLALTMPLEGVQWIEASAGTGKTYTLAGLFTRLVVERRLSVREILVVTYTRAAADELRARLAARLNLCAEIASNPLAASDADASEIAFCESLIKTAEGSEPRREVVRRLRLAAVSLDEAQISTVHAFCQRALREHGWAAGIAPLEGQLIDNERARYDAIARDLWRERATANDAIAWDAVLDVAPNPAAFADLLWELRDERCELEPRVDTPVADLRVRIEAFASMWDLLCRTWEAENERAFAALLAHSVAGHLNLQSYPPKKIGDEYAALRIAFALPRLDTKLIPRYAHDAIASKIKKGKTPFPPQALFVAFRNAMAAHESVQSAKRQLGLHLLRDAADEARRRSERNKRAQRVFSYDDLVVQLHHAVLNGAAQALAKQFPAALVDESQDSDARQFELFFAIYQARDLLCLIGDPKQAIYRFRGGDVNAYLRARTHASAQHPLKQNFRSVPALVSALDQVYKGTRAPFGDPDITFESVAAAGDARDDDFLIDGKTASPLQFWRVPADDRFGNKGDATDLLAAGCAEEIHRLLVLAQNGFALLRRKDDDGVRRHLPLRAQDIAVLVNAHFEAAQVQSALAARGVPAVVVSRESVFSTEEASDLRAILRALAEFDEARLRGVLATRLLGLAAADIAALSREAESWREQIGVFAAWRTLWREHGVLALLERIAEGRAAALLARPDGERRLTNLLHLADLLQQAAAGLDGERALIDWLARRIAHADRDNEAEQLRLESDGDRVHISTLHVSKGLQYPIVFLPFAPIRREPSKSPYLKFTRGDRKIIFVRDRATDDEAKEAALAEERGERLRLLYVGLTRAQAVCYVACGKVGGSSEPSALAQLLADGVDENVPAAVSALALEDPAMIALSELPAPQSGRLAPQDAVALGPARIARRKVRLLRESHSYSRLSANGRAEQPGEDEASVVVAESVDDAIAVTPTPVRGARFGVAFHEIIEDANLAAWRDASTSIPLDEKNLIDRVLRRHGLDSEPALREMTRLIQRTLTGPLLPALRMCDLEANNSRREMPFHFAIAEADATQWLKLLQHHGYLRDRERFVLDENRLRGLMSGLLDLVFVHDARWWIVDYKTNYLGADAISYAPDRLQAAVRAAEYDLQYLIYLVALHRWLKTRVPGYDYARDIGGALYVFVRGIEFGGGIYRDTPPVALIEAMDQLLTAPTRATA